MRVLLALVRVGIELVAIAALFLLAYSVNAALGMNARAQTSGTIAGLGLRAPVEIVRDNRGIPHIRAKNEHDMFFAQGYAQAQDRAFQMDLLRRFVDGELAEILGGVALQADESARALPVRALVAKQWERLTPQEQADFTAFSDGVNAAFAREPRAVEFRLLMYTPKPWTPQDSLAVGFATVLDLADGWNDIADRIGRKVALSDPCYDAPTVAGLARMADPKRCDRNVALAPLFDDHRDPIGSNDWATGAAKNTTGRALVANDPHLNLRIPGPWYMIDMQSPGYHAAGVVLAGIPGVILGHNDHIAWGATNGTTTAMSLFEMPNNIDSSKYQTETFHVRFGADQTNRYYRTATEFTEAIKLRGAARDVLVRWSAYSDPISPIATFDQLDRAQTLDEATKALRLYTGPTQNFVVGDTSGRAMYHLAGPVPNDPLWGNAIHPTSDLTKTYPLIPFDALPNVAPSRDAVVWSANAKMYGAGYRYRLSGQFAPPYRAYRIAQLLRAKSKYDVDYFHAMQLDTLSVAELDLAQHFSAFKGWDGRFSPDSTQASAMFVLRSNLVKQFDTFADAMVAIRAKPSLLAAIAPQASPEPWGVAGAAPVLHPLAALGFRFLNGRSLPGNGDAHTLRCLKKAGSSQSYRAVWDVGNWDAGGMSLPEGESGAPGSGHYTDQANDWIAGKLVAFPYSDAAVDAAASDRLSLTP